VTVRASRSLLLLGASLLATLAGCHASVTEVVVVVDTNLSLPAEADTFELEIRSSVLNENHFFGSSPPPDGGVLARGALPTFPATIGIVPHDDGAYVPFGVTAVLLRTPAGASQPSIVVERSATGVQFVRGQTRMLFLSLTRACMCAGTNCPTTAACGDLTSPTLSAFDPAHLPRVDGGAVGGPDGGADTSAPVDGAIDRLGDASAEGSVETRPDAPADVGTDAASDRESDVAPEAPPADAPPDERVRFPLGHTCAAASECQDNICVDGVCCENQCACGSCGGATPGKCVPAAAGTDPRDVCLLYTCDGNGACATTCLETYGSCDGACKPGVGVCNGIGNCVPTISRQNYCVVGTCVCDKGLTCQPQDAGPGQCL
jgi:hypothetical protein